MDISNDTTVQAILQCLKWEWLNYGQIEALMKPETLTIDVLERMEAAGLIKSFDGDDFDHGLGYVMTTLGTNSMRSVEGEWEKILITNKFWKMS